MDTSAPTITLGALTDTGSGTYTSGITLSEAASDNLFEVADLTVGNGTATLTGSGTDFTATITPGDNGSVEVDVRENAAIDAAGNASFASNSLTINFIDEAFVAARTTSVINNFLHARSKAILNHEPDLSGRLDDRGGLGASEQFALSADYVDGALDVSFGGSLTRSRAMAADSDSSSRQPRLSAQAGTASDSLADGAAGASNAADTLSVDGGTHALGADAGASAGAALGNTAPAQRGNVWVKGQLSYADTDGRDFNFGSVHLGADYRFDQRFLAGVMVSVDWAEEDDSANATSASGVGWMVGPYAVVRLSDTLIFDGRLAYGQSDNEVSPLGTYTDDFDTTRFLARGQLTGDFAMGDWTLTPQIAATYLSETQHAYTDSNGVAIPEQTVELGQLTFGPTISRSIQLGDGVTVTPSLGVEGIWTFAETGTADINTGFIDDGDEGLRARIDLGLAFDINAIDLTLLGFYDGLGQDDYESYGASVKAKIPF